MALLVERQATDAVRKPLHDERPIGHRRQQPRRDAHVEAEQFALGDPEIGPEHLAQIGDADPVAIRQRQIAVTTRVFEFVELADDVLDTRVCR